MNYIDIHCHIDDEKFDADRGEVLGRMREQGILGITIGTSLEDSKKAVEIAENNENIWACVGVHPMGSSDDIRSTVFDEEQFTKLVQSPKVVGVGECGLDFFRTTDEEDKLNQKKLFKQQIEFALKFDKPLMLHCRNAYDEVLEILREYKKEAGDKLRGNCHFFAGNVEQARGFVDLGFSCSFTGVVTFAHDYDEVVRSLPIENIMSETDSPYVAPIPYRGQRCEPTFVVETVKKLAEIRGEEVDILNQAIVNNARRLFRINSL